MVGQPIEHTATCPITTGIGMSLLSRVRVGRQRQDDEVGQVVMVRQQGSRVVQIKADPSQISMPEHRPFQYTSEPEQSALRSSDPGPDGGHPRG